MLNSYKDGCLMNESYVFYSSINTFRNPIFEPPQAAEQQEGAGQLGQRQSPASSCSMSSTSSSPSSVALVEGEESVQAGDHQQRHQPTERARIPKSCSNNTSVGSNQSEPGRRWQEFCDNLSLSIRGRLFVMESNLKRRIRAMREYVDKKMPWISPLVSQKRRSAARGEPNSTGVQQAKLERGLGRFQFPEPQSAKTLEVQEERLLNRLKRIKRERQLASSASAGARASQVAIDHADGSPGSLREALPSSSSSPPSSFSSSSASSSASASASDSSEAETMASGGGGGGALTGALGPVLLETGAPPLGLFSSINEPVQANSKSKVSKASGNRNDAPSCANLLFVGPK